MKQYHVRVTRIYDVFVDAETEDEALDWAEENYWEQNNGLADDWGAEVVDSYPVPGTENEED